MPWPTRSRTTLKPAPRPPPAPPRRCRRRDCPAPRRRSPPASARSRHVEQPLRLRVDLADRDRRRRVGVVALVAARRRRSRRCRPPSSTRFCDGMPCTISSLIDVQTRAGKSVQPLERRRRAAWLRMNSSAIASRSIVVMPGRTSRRSSATRGREDLAPRGHHLDLARALELDHVASRLR